MISVVIPAYNEEKTLPACLESLSSQNTDLPFEVIVVDNASTDRTAAVAKKFSGKINLRIISEKTKGRSPARRAGFTAAAGEIILSTDADTVVPANWISGLTGALNSGNYIAVTGPCRITDQSPLANSFFNRFQPFIMFCWRLTKGYYWLNGFNFGIRRDSYLQSGGFNPHRNTLEDLDLSLRVARIGQIKFVPRITVTFSGRRFNQNMLKGLLEYAGNYFDIYLLKKPDSFLSDVR